MPISDNTLDTARFAEYEATGPGATASALAARASQFKQLGASGIKEIKFADMFGNRSHDNGWQSFEEATGGLATMTTTLGARRKQNDPVPAARPAQTCNPLAQDCGRPELACHVGTQNYCALAGSAGKDLPCSTDTACARGLGCIASSLTPMNYVCEPYCDANNMAAANGCGTLCPDSFYTLVDAAQQPLSGQCLPP